MNDTMSTTTTTLPGNEDLAEYDNSAFRDEETPYTLTLEREQQSPYETLSASAKSYLKPQTRQDSGVMVDGDVIAGGSSSLRSSTEGADSAAISVAKSDNVELNEDHSDGDVQTPDYYKLEPE